VSPDPAAGSAAADGGRYLVTGCAGFIGSQLVESLLDDGHTVVGVDSFTSYYPRSAKEENLAEALADQRFSLVEADLADGLPAGILRPGDTVVHLAAQPGVRLSWDDFDVYLACNVRATRCLLDACLEIVPRRVVYASSSSVYGDAETYPTSEAALPRPVSPYGVTKLAAEHLLFAYAARAGFEAVALRYFTVYGPRQRPDMATYRLVESALRQVPFRLLGDGRQVRDFTFVGDVVSATALAASTEVPVAGVFNISGGSACELNEIIGLVAELCGIDPIIHREDRAAGDVDRTGADATRALAVLGWTPRIGLPEGLGRQVAWQRRSLAVADGPGDATSGRR
jgi:UDP-glucuronate 4-epimerase